MDKKRVTVAIIIIGNEILSGKTQDINLNFLANRFSNLGYLLKEVRIIRDVKEQIIKAVNYLSNKYCNVLHVVLLSVNLYQVGTCDPTCIKNQSYEI